MRKRFYLAMAVALCAAACSRQTNEHFDLLITNARIIDGTGQPGVTGSVAVRDGKIVQVGQLRGTADRTIDAAGKVLAPGFIDPHSHSDLPLIVDGNAQSKIRQGVTTEVLGENDSVAPRLPGTGSPNGEKQEWSDFNGYFDLLQRSGTSVNILS